MKIKPPVFEIADVKMVSKLTPTQAKVFSKLKGGSWKTAKDLKCQVKTLKSLMRHGLLRVRNKPVPDPRIDIRKIPPATNLEFRLMPSHILNHVLKVMLGKAKIRIPVQKGSTRFGVGEYWFIPLVKSKA